MQAVMSTNGLKKQLENWSEINWRKVNKLVKNLRHRIFRARELGNFRKLRNLQKLMQRSYANLLLLEKAPPKIWFELLGEKLSELQNCSQPKLDLSSLW